MTNMAPLSIYLHMFIYQSFFLLPSMPFLPDVLCNDYPDTVYLSPLCPSINLFFSYLPCHSCQTSCAMTTLTQSIYLHMSIYQSFFLLSSMPFLPDVLCSDYPGPNGYYFECVDKSNSEFSCRSTCGPSLNSIGTGPEFDLLNNGGGNLLLGKKNKGSLFDFSDFRNGTLLHLSFFFFKVIFASIKLDQFLHAQIPEFKV